LGLFLSYEENKVLWIPIQNTIFTEKQITLSAMTSGMINVKFNWTMLPDKTYIANLHCPSNPMVSGMPAMVSIDRNNNCKILLKHCAPYDITIDQNDLLGLLEIEEEEIIPLADDIIATLCADIHERLPKVIKWIFLKENIAQVYKLQVPNEFKNQYINILYKHQDTITIDKYDLGLAKNYSHRKHLKNNYLAYHKQFKIPEDHQTFIEQTLEEWLKLGVIKRSNSVYNSPIYYIPKKQGQWLRIMQDFPELSQNSHINKYSMKEIAKCIRDIGWANSDIFTTLGLNSGIWNWRKNPSISWLLPYWAEVSFIGSPHPTENFSTLCHHYQPYKDCHNGQTYPSPYSIHSSTHSNNEDTLFCNTSPKYHLDPTAGHLSPP
jgi:hypothetical protein